MTRGLFTPRFRRLALAVSLWLILSASLVPAASLPTAKPAEVGFSAERLERLTRVMQDYIDQGKVSGLVALVARKGRVAYLKPFGKLDLERGTLMPANGIFRIASQTKAVTSVAVMILQEEGRILLDDPVSKYIPEFAGSRVAVRAADKGGQGYSTVPLKRPITIRDLLTHTAGI
ncbi:MAG: serine hydrolase domain-containing protein, partial [Candidatus Aminicenantes bacterium]|nr:serine hydrolase domain-containing protein [Candidatus Aminicenantes bacterium]